IGRGEDHRRALTYFRPTLDIAAARRERLKADVPDLFDERDVYGDARPCLSTLRALGYRVGIAGNQPVEAEARLRRMFAVDLVASSAGLGAAKPNPLFFAKLIELAQVPAAHIAYVGDRLDNDILPARKAGLFAIFIARGPWGRAHRRQPDIARAHRVISTLAVLPLLLAEL